MSACWNDAYDLSPLSCCAIYGIEDFPYDKHFDAECAKNLIDEMQEHESQARARNKSVMLVSLNSNQKKARALLKRLGFRSTTMFSRPIRGDVTVCLMYKAVKRG